MPTFLLIFSMLGFHSFTSRGQTIFEQRVLETKFLSHWLNPGTEVRLTLPPDSWKLTSGLSAKQSVSFSKQGRKWVRALNVSLRVKRMRRFWSSTVVAIPTPRRATHTFWNSSATNMHAMSTTPLFSLCRKNLTPSTTGGVSPKLIDRSSSMDRYPGLSLDTNGFSLLRSNALNALLTYGHVIRKKSFRNGARSDDGWRIQLGTPGNVPSSSFSMLTGSSQTANAVRSRRSWASFFCSSTEYTSHKPPTMRNKNGR
mmetsp:Transcript_7614/g.14874  ORF Transcript_7614/g.14874 Transcript_7614/m.14874 type:complete len:256 (-) Transcript_7614:97-864(-)